MYFSVVLVLLVCRCLYFDVIVNYFILFELSVFVSLGLVVTGDRRSLHKLGARVRDLLLRDLLRRDWVL